MITPFSQPACVFSVKVKHRVKAECVGIEVKLVLIIGGLTELDCDFGAVDGKEAGVGVVGQFVHLFGGVVEGVVEGAVEGACVHMRKG